MDASLGGNTLPVSEQYAIMNAYKESAGLGNPWFQTVPGTFEAENSQFNISEPLGDLLPSNVTAKVGDFFQQATNDVTNFVQRTKASLPDLPDFKSNLW